MRHSNDSNDSYNNNTKWYYCWPPLFCLRPQKLLWESLLVVSREHAFFPTNPQQASLGFRCHLPSISLRTLKGPPQGTSEDVRRILVWETRWRDRLLLGTFCFPYISVNFQIKVLMQLHRQGIWATGGGNTSKLSQAGGLLCKLRMIRPSITFSLKSQHAYPMEKMRFVFKGCCCAAWVPRAMMMSAIVFMVWRQGAFEKRLQPYLFRATLL